MSRQAPRAAVLFQRDEFHTAKVRIMGRHSANEGFIRAWARHAGCDEFFAFVAQDSDYKAFEQVVRDVRLAFAGQTPVTRCIGFHQPQLLATAGLLFVPDPNLAAQAFTREFHAVPGAAAAYSLCGITHTLSSHAAMELITRLVTAPLQAWDALICTSKAARQSVDYLLNCYSEYLAAHFSIAPPRAALQLPIIPLGVDCALFVTGDERERLRAHWRQQLGIGPDAVAVLYFGRMSFHAKANPYPLYRALQIARERSNTSIHLLMVGQAPNDAIAQAFRDGAAQACPDVNMHFLDGSDVSTAKEIWYAADIFGSLADNIQETFGLTPLEAMAAGLPCVVSDWDGYRDTVVDGQTGFLIPSCAPARDGVGVVLALRYAQGLDNYDHYIGNASKCVAVDIEAAARAFESLVVDSELRRKLGTQGRARALITFDWKHVIAAYEELWLELDAIRHAGTPAAPADLPVPGSPAPRSHPLHPDPFALFAGHASHAHDALLFSAADVRPGAVDACLQLKILNFGLPLPRPVIDAIFAALGSSALSNAALFAPLREININEITRCLGWLVKAGLVRATPIQR